MYSVILLASFSIAPDIPDARARRASSGCAGNVARAQGCSSAVQYVPAESAGCQGSFAGRYKVPYGKSGAAYVTVYNVGAGCSGGFAAAPSYGCHGSAGGRAFASLRNAAERRHDRVAARRDARAARHGGETTTFYSVAAVPVNTPQQAPVPQSHCPPGAKP